MYARTVTVDLNTDMWDEALEFGASVQDEIAAFPGLRSWVLVGSRETGKGTSFALFESKASFDAVNDDVNAILAEFATYFSSPPSETLGDVLAYVDNT